jgi:hypothetical protein
MVASVATEEPLGMDEVLNILDEASQIRAYSYELEKKSRELEEATRELKDANERLKEIDLVKDDFMSSVTHELRTPLSSIRAFSEILFDDPKVDLQERKRFLGIIVAETERLSRLVNQVLDLAKIESGHADWHTGDVDLTEVIGQAIDSLEQLIRDKGVEVQRHLPEQPCMVSGDRDRLTQVVVNLLSNAVKFAPSAGGLIVVRLTRQPKSCRLSMSDNGPGIAVSEHKNIFEKFQQVTNGADKPLGTGLGLPISRQIIEHLGGRIWVESEATKGATFIFELPRIITS